MIPDLIGSGITFSSFSQNDRDSRKLTFSHFQSLSVLSVLSVSVVGARSTVRTTRKGDPGSSISSGVRRPRGPTSPQTRRAQAPEAPRLPASVHKAARRHKRTCVHVLRCHHARRTRVHSISILWTRGDHIRPIERPGAAVWDVIGYASRASTLRQENESMPGKRGAARCLRNSLLGRFRGHTRRGF
jgi:hypothetical protein